MTPQEAVAYIENYTWSASRLGLERTRELLHALGDPQKQLKFIHVAGSNGKGSTCAMLESILRCAGYRTGLYISPYIQQFCERIQIGGHNIPGERLAAITEQVQTIADHMADHPSQFELVTAIAMVYFQQEHCDIVVLEVGMGGALDSTNVIDAPEVAVITNIGLEHTEYLGSTLAEIAATKAGIIKPGCCTVCYDGAPEVTQVIAQVCREKGVPMHLAKWGTVKPLDHGLHGQRFAWREQEYLLPLLGEHQLRNAAVVLETILALLRRGWTISEGAVRDGLARVEWPARFEVLGLAPLFILDGGHNPQCAQALSAALSEVLPGEKVVFLMGVLADKNYEAMLDILLPHAAEFICVTPDSPRSLSGADLAAVIEDKCTLPTEVCHSVIQAIPAALSRGLPVIAFGSLYMAGSIRTAFHPTFRKWLRQQKIKARDNYTPDERAHLSEKVVEQIVSSPEFRAAKTVLIYRATRGEVRLEALEKSPAAQGKQLAFPLCVSDTEMIALHPNGPDAWKNGYYGIEEPVPECSRLIRPEELDFILCPCTVFDEWGSRMGMGAGFYDRYLTHCRPDACIASVAFECQKAEKIPVDSWDHPMDVVFTEKATYRFHS